MWGLFVRFFGENNGAAVGAKQSIVRDVLLIASKQSCSDAFWDGKVFSCYFIWINEGRLVPARRAEIVTQDEYEDATAHSGESKRG